MNASEVRSCLKVRPSRADSSRRKVAERELLVRLFEPFKCKVAGTAKFHTEKLEDLVRYLEAGREPALGGMIRGLGLASKPFRPNEPLLVTELRKFVQHLPGAAAIRLREERFLQRLRALGSVRNALAHIGNPVPHELEVVSSLVLDGNQPGELLRVLIPALRPATPAASQGL